MYMGLSYNSSATVDCPPGKLDSRNWFSIQYLNREIDLTELPEEAASKWRHAARQPYGLEELEWRDSTILAETATAIADGLSRNHRHQVSTGGLYASSTPDSDISWRVMLQHNTDVDGPANCLFAVSDQPKYSAAGLR
jgi:hypothetical protein